MTDYLEELLERQVSDEEGGTLDWRKGSLRLWERQAWEQVDANAQGHRQEHSADDAVTYRENLSGQGDMQTLVQAAAEAVWHKRAGQLPLVGQMARLHRAALQAREHSGGGNAAVQSVMQPGMADIRHGGVLSVRRAADYAAAVDAAFQRDARRYDGPLGLL